MANNILTAIENALAVGLARELAPPPVEVSLAQLLDVVRALVGEARSRAPSDWRKPERIAEAVEHELGPLVDGLTRYEDHRMMVFQAAGALEPVNQRELALLLLPSFERDLLEHHRQRVPLVEFVDPRPVRRNEIAFQTVEVPDRGVAHALYAPQVQTRVARIAFALPTQQPPDGLWIDQVTIGNRSMLVGAVPLASYLGAAGLQIDQPVLAGERVDVALRNDNYQQRSISVGFSGSRAL